MEKIRWKSTTLLACLDFKKISLKSFFHNLRLCLYEADEKGSCFCLLGFCFCFFFHMLLLDANTSAHGMQSV